MLSSGVPIPLCGPGALGHEEMQPIEALMAVTHTDARDGREAQPTACQPSPHHFVRCRSQPGCLVRAMPRGGWESPEPSGLEGRGHMVTATDKVAEEQRTPGGGPWVLKCGEGPAARRVPISLMTSAGGTGHGDSSHVEAGVSGEKDGPGTLWKAWE